MTGYYKLHLYNPETGRKEFCTAHFTTKEEALVHVKEGFIPELEYCEVTPKQQLCAILDFLCRHTSCNGCFRHDICFNMHDPKHRKENLDEEELLDLCDKMVELIDKREYEKNWK